MTEVLWNHLGTLNSKMQVTCIELLHQLLNTLVWDDSVEQILGEALLRGDETTRVASLLRFVKVWTVGREIQVYDMSRVASSIPCPRLGVEWIGWISWLPRAPLGPIFMTGLYSV